MLHAALDRWAARQPQALFAVQSDQRIRYVDAQLLSRRIAISLRRAGLGPGDRVAVLAKNRIEYVLLLYAASYAGVTLVPLNTRLAPAEWACILADARPRVLFVESSFVPSIDALPDLDAERVTFDADSARRPGWRAFADWLAPPSADEPAELEADPARDVLQLYTSATTGQPKGAVLTQRAVCANVAQVGEAIAASPADRSLVVAPLFHAAVVPSTLAPLANGASVYLHADFVPGEVLGALAAERISYAVLVPAVLQACLAAMPADTSFDTLRLIYYGSSPIAEPTLRAVLHAFGCDLMQSYGLTEATQAVTFLTPADHHHALQSEPGLLQSAGRAAPQTQIGIVDADDQLLPPGRSGEVVVRGPQPMRGYWNQPQETQSVLRNGWLHTGDVGTLDARGYLTIHDRLKDMVVSGGENVYPRAIEEVLMQHPAVREVAVIGVPDARWGETVKAVVVPNPDVPVTAEELIMHCRGSLGGFEVPRSVDFTDALPRNAAGKVLKRLLRDPYWSGRQRQVAGA